MDLLANRMKLAAQASGISREAIAKRIDVADSTLRHYFLGTRTPRLDTLYEFGQITNSSYDWLLGNTHADINGHVSSQVLEPNHGLSKIDVIDAYLPTESLTEKVIGQIAFSTHFLDRAGIKPSEAKIIQVNGSEMAPTLPSGSLVMIDLRDKQPTSQSVLFAYRSDKEVSVRYLEYFKAGEMLVRSSNPTLPTKLYPIQSDDLEILGRVVWSCQIWPENQ